jgi:hypothetical protein
MTDELNSAEPPPPFDPQTAEPWDNLRDPGFASDDEARAWDGESVYADGPQELNLTDPELPEDDE